MELIQTSLLLNLAKGTDFEQVIAEAKSFKTYWEKGRPLEVGRYSRQYKDTSIRIQEKIMFTPLGIFEEKEGDEPKEKTTGFGAVPSPTIMGARVHERLKRNVDTGSVQGYEYVLANLTLTSMFDVRTRFGFSYSNVVDDLVSELLRNITGGPNPIVLENIMRERRYDYNESTNVLFIIRYDLLQLLSEALESENDMLDKVEELLSKGYFPN